MKIAEVREKESAELTKTVAELRKELWTMRHKAQTEPIDRPSRVSEIRRTIGRILTVLREREMEGAKSS